LHKNGFGVVDTIEPTQNALVSTADNQPTKERPVSKSTWPIEHVSRSNVKKCYSDAFIAGGYKWRVMMFVKGNNLDHLSIYLDVAGSATLPYGWSRDAFFSLAIVKSDSSQVHHPVRNTTPVQCPRQRVGIPIIHAFT